MKEKVRPEYINFYGSVEDIHEKRIIKRPIAEAEEIIAKHRKITSFTWAEIFDCETLINNYRERIVDSADLALCYFGDDVGYGVVSVKEIKKGSILFYPGEILNSFKDKDVMNPYLSKVNDKKYIDAKHIGGMGSMVMDLPNEDNGDGLTKMDKTVKKEELALANFAPVVLSFNSIDYVAIVAIRNIDAGEIIGGSYNETTRLMYSNFIGFYRDGKRLEKHRNDKLNKIIYKCILYRDLSDQHVILYKVIAALEKQKTDKAVSMLYKYRDNIYFNQLTTTELIQVKNRIEENSKDNLGGSFFQLTNHLKKFINSELTFRENDSRSFSERNLAIIVIKSNRDQLKHKGALTRLHSIDDMKNYYVIYPEAPSDFEKIGDIHQETGRQEVALTYYRCALLYNKKTKTLSSTREKIIENKINNLETFPMEIR